MGVVPDQDLNGKHRRFRRLVVEQHAAGPVGLGIDEAGRQRAAVGTADGFGIRRDAVVGHQIGDPPAVHDQGEPVQHGFAGEQPGSGQGSHHIVSVTLRR